jgi:hypothetical protein
MVSIAFAHCRLRDQKSISLLACGSDGKRGQQHHAVVSARRSEVFPLQLSKRAVKLTITNFGTISEQCLQRCQERRPLVGLQRTGGVDNGDLLLLSEGHGRKIVARKTGFQGVS